MDYSTIKKGVDIQALKIIYAEWKIINDGLNMSRQATKNVRIKIRGLVQGVGFRPFVYRAAEKNRISGWVKNRQDGLLIEASGKEESLNSFLINLRNNSPAAAQIQNIQVNASKKAHKKGFQIDSSDENPNQREITQIGPDIAVCTECLEDMKTQAYRVNYPFINCTNCGPRFSIIRNLPYDRSKTTMDVFEMCPVCKSEYEDPHNRRFHAQPVACLNCGPHYKIKTKEQETEIQDEVLELTSGMIDEGKIVAIKGIGGFFIACDATNRETVKQLRELKLREGKPFAVMFQDVHSVQNYCYLNTEEKEILTSWRRPIVILKSKKKLPESVSRGIRTVGALLPYMPFHFLLFEKLKTRALIFTSGNFPDEPIVVSNTKAEEELAKICDAVVSYNRRIYNRTDDSVLQVINKKPRLMRRSRGWVPNPVFLDVKVDGILATGAELKNTFCIGKGNQAILSQHIGDLKDFETWSFYEKNIRQFKKMFQVEPELIAADFHLDYLSTKYALESGLPLNRVQHHHAHIASAMAENGLDEKVIGISFDGTGLGDDGNSWGSEFFICDLLEYERRLHFEYIPLPGGDLAVKEPWRMAVSWLYKVFNREFLKFSLPFLKSVSKNDLNRVIKSIDNKINAPLTCGAGRLFDAVSALLELCPHSTFEAEAPMRLENRIARDVDETYSWKISETIEFSEMFIEIISDLLQKINPAVISAKFHNTISEIVVEGADIIRKETGFGIVVLSGGTFQNKYLTERTEQKLRARGFKVFSNCSVPCNDGGISLGQLVVAAKRRSVQPQLQFI
ncbi:carbamoyltransferase HypF [Prolixibacteraceae bacterium Z1-6]|uniref:Carbamoyltransferase n=1 Tax=Draconibacterium aestuarii TaxID=2998507 RepID=A0A9X3J731_9BACT|nr:carbamoyltransferase HypF [Prolixibacteraceae bacterium Z1-6]